MAVSKAGFASGDRLIDLTADEGLDLILDLVLARRTDTVEVSADDPPLIEPTQTALGRTITTRELDGLPMSVGLFRDLAGLATLAPGMVADFATNSRGLVTAGQGVNSNLSVVDGLPGEIGPLPIDAVREYRVVTNGFEPEFGQASGAATGVVTRSGTNAPAGRLSWFQQSGTLDSTSPIASRAGASDPGFTQTDVSGFWGGPLRRDDVFFFAAGEENIRHAQFVNASADVAREFRPGESLSTPVDWNLPQSFVRLDAHVTNSNTLTVSHVYSLVRGDDAAREALSANERRRALDNPTTALEIAETAVFRSALVNEARVRGSLRRFTQTVDGFCPGCATLNYPGILLGKPASAPQDDHTTKLEAADTLTWITHGPMGAHVLKAGGQWFFSRQGNVTSNTVGTYRFTNDLPFDPLDAASYPVQFTQNLNGRFHSERESIGSLFAQDEWHASARVTLHAGLRWDRTRWPASAVEDDVAPRLGVAITPWGGATTAIRASLGRYYDERLLQIAIDADAGEQLTIANPGFQGSLVSIDPFGPNPRRGDDPAVAVLSPSAFAPTATPYTDQLSVGIQQAFGRTIGVTADVVRARGHRLPIEMDLNYPDPVTGLRANPSIFQEIAVRTIAQSWYTGLQVGLVARSTGGVVVSLAYTLSKAENDTDGSGSFPSNEANILIDRGPTLDDARQRLTASATIPLASGWSVQTVTNAWTPLPYNVTSGFDANGDGVPNDRPPGVARNSARGAGFLQADARVTKVFRLGRRRLECLAEVFNLTNRANWMNYNGNMRARGGGFGAPGASGPPRQIQLGLRWSY